MYTLADKAISEDEFLRAVSICTGRVLSRHLVHTVFQIFDNDGDGLLSYQVHYSTTTTLAGEEGQLALCCRRCRCC